MIKNNNKGKLNKNKGKLNNNKGKLNKNKGKLNKINRSTIKKAQLIHKK